MTKRAFSSVGRAPGLHPGCREFESLSAHFFYQMTAIFIRAFSSVGRAPGLHPGCREFESLSAHSFFIITGCSAAGSALGLGPRCRRFESCHPDYSSLKRVSFFILNGNIEKRACRIRSAMRGGTWEFFPASNYSCLSYFSYILHDFHYLQLKNFK